MIRKLILAIITLLLFVSTTNADLHIFSTPPAGSNGNGGFDIEVTTQPGISICDKFNHAMAASYPINGAVRVTWRSGTYIDTSNISCLIPQTTQTGSNLNANLSIWAYGVVLAVAGTQTTMMESNYQGNESHLDIHGLRLSVTNSQVTRGFAWKQVYHNVCTDCSVILNTKAIITRGSTAGDVVPIQNQPLGTIISVSDPRTDSIPPNEPPGTGTVWTSPTDYVVTGAVPLQTITWVPGHGPAVGKVYAVVFSPSSTLTTNYVGNRVAGDTTSFSQQATFHNMLINVQGQYPFVGAGLAFGIPVCNQIQGQSSYINWDHPGIYNCGTSYLFNDDPTDLICLAGTLSSGQCMVCGTNTVFLNGQCVSCPTNGDILTGTQCQPSNTAPVVGTPPTVGAAPVGNGIIPSEVTITNGDVEGASVAAIKPVQSSQVQATGGIWSIENTGFDNVNYVYDASQAPALGIGGGGPWWHANTLIGDYKAFFYNPLNLTHVLGTSDDYGGGGGYVAARRIRGGTNFDELSLQAGFRQGIMGTMNGNGLPAPKLSIVPITGSDYGRTGQTGTFCYAGIAIDFAGNRSDLGPLACIGIMPNTLSTKNTLLIADTGVDSYYPRTGVCGWQIYGRGVTGPLFMNPGGKLCGSTPVTLLATDPQIQIGAQIAPEFGDDGSLTPSGAPPTGPATSGVWNPGIAGLGSVLEPPYTIATLPTYASQVQTLPSGTACGTYFRMDQVSGNGTDQCHAQVATAVPDSGTITYNRASTITDDGDASILFATGAGHAAMFTVPANVNLPTGDNWCIAFAWSRAVDNVTGCVFGQTSGGVGFCVDSVANQAYVSQAGNPTIEQTLGGYSAATGAHFTVLSDTNTTIRMIIDGADLSRQTRFPNLTPADNRLTIGNDATGTFQWQGIVDEFATYPVPCTNTDMDNLYKAWIKRKNGSHAYATDVNCSFLYANGNWKAQDCGMNTVATLPDCTKVKGGWSMVTNNNAACATTGFWVNPVAGGAFNCPVKCDGTNAVTGWRID